MLSRQYAQEQQWAFVGRTRELDALRAAYDAPAGQLVLLYGRRRIGKTYLLQRFSEDRRAIFYQATRQAEGDELAAFTRQCEAAARRHATRLLPSRIGRRRWNISTARQAPSGSS